MTRAAATEQAPQRVDRLLRSLVGITEVRPAWQDGKLRNVHILKDGRVADHQLTRNIVSGLKAGFGIHLDTTRVCIYEDAAAFGDAVGCLEPEAATGATGAADEPAAAEAPAARAPGGANGNGTAKPAATAGNGASNGTSNGKSNGTSNGASVRPEVRAANGTNGNGLSRTAMRARRTSRPAPATFAPANGRESAGRAMLLERLDMERHGGMLRCRVVLVLDEHRYSAIAEAPAGPAAEAELAARVTLDALRAGALTAARLDGIGFTKVGDTTYLVAAIRDSADSAPRASATPLVESMARSATEAVLQVVGPVTPTQRTTAERELGRL